MQVCGETFSKLYHDINQSEMVKASSAQGVKQVFWQTWL